jgi:hypothetical protein
MAIGRPRLDADIRRWQCGGLGPAAVAGDAFAGSRRCALVDPKGAWRHRRGAPPHDRPADPDSCRHQLYPPMSPESEQLEEGTPGQTGSLPSHCRATAGEARHRCQRCRPGFNDVRGLVPFRGVELVSPSLLWIEGVSALHATVARRKSCASRRPIGDAPPTIRSRRSLTDHEATEPRDQFGLPRYTGCRCVRNGRPSEVHEVSYVVA